LAFQAEGINRLAHAFLELLHSAKMPQSSRWKLISSLRRMAFMISTPLETPADDIKHVPEDAVLRRAIRAAASPIAADLDHAKPPSREALEHAAKKLLEELDLPVRFLGFAMVAVSNAYWQPFFEAVPFARRLFLLPHCLSDRKACAGSYDSIGLHCAGCGKCDIHGLKNEAERRGYTVVVAEGTSSVLLKVLEEGVEAIFGVACLDSLEKSFRQIVELGIPHVAIPLLKNGCVDTEAEVELIQTMLAAESSSSTMPPRNYSPLLRETASMFHLPQFSELLAPYAEAENEEITSSSSVEEIALDWLKNGGKRLRPFVTIASYLAARHGLEALSRSGDFHETAPLAVRRLALAIESLHKASLVHDDIEDDDDFRYGRPVLHRIHGLGQAINVGDYLIGLGYQLIAGETASLGAECTGDIFRVVSHAHLELCRGQGAELQLSRQSEMPDDPLEVLNIYAQKTAPAFEAAVYAGLRAAGIAVPSGVLKRFSRYLGNGYQIRNDLNDWQADESNKRKIGLDVLANRPTILHVFAMNARNDSASPIAEFLESLERFSPEERLEQVRQWYHRSGAFEKAERLCQKMRDRALEAADEFPTDDLRELMRFLVRIVLWIPPSSRMPAG
jgi:geranylgeranyl diphosphate synthase, type II